MMRTRVVSFDDIARRQDRVARYIRRPTPLTFLFAAASLMPSQTGMPLPISQ
jgi:hypothetical protein